MINSQPGEVTSLVSGSGAVDFVHRGAQVDAGTTAGDYARLYWVDLGQFADWSSVDKIEAWIAINNYDTALPHGDELKIGLGGGTNDAFLDWQNGQYNVNGTTTGATLPAANEGIILHITIDYAADETIFESLGGVSETATISATPSAPSSGLLRVTSDGGTSRALVLWARYAITEVS